MFLKKKKENEEIQEFKGGKIKALLEKVSFIDNLDCDGETVEKVDILEARKDLSALKAEMRCCIKTWEEESALETALKDVIAVLEHILSGHGKLEEEELSYGFMGRLQGIFFVENHISSHCTQKYGDALSYFEKAKKSVENALAFEKRTRSDLALDAIGNAEAIEKTVRNIDRKMRQLEILDAILSDVKGRCEKKEADAIIDCDEKAGAQGEDMAIRDAEGMEEIPMEDLVEPYPIELPGQKISPAPPGRLLAIPEGEGALEESCALKETEEEESPQEPLESVETLERKETAPSETAVEMPGQEEPGEMERQEFKQGTLESLEPLGPEETAGLGNKAEPEKTENMEETKPQGEAEEQKIQKEPGKPEEMEHPEGLAPQEEPGETEIIKDKEGEQKTGPEGTEEKEKPFHMPGKNKISFLKHLMSKKEDALKKQTGNQEKEEALFGKAGEKRIPYKECRNLLYAPGLLCFLDKEGRLYLGAEPYKKGKAYENTKGNAYLYGGGEALEELFDLLTISYDPLLMEADERAFAKAYTAMEWVYGNYTALTGEKLPLNSYMAYKAYYNQCVKTYMGHKRKERERHAKAAYLSGEISRYLLLFGKEGECSYLPQILAGDTEGISLAFEEIVKNDVVDGELKGQLTKLLFSAGNVDSFSFPGEGDKAAGQALPVPVEDFSGEVLHGSVIEKAPPLEAENVRLLLKKESVSGAYTVDSVSPANMSYLVKEFYITMCYAKELGIQYNGENIFLIRYDNEGRRPMAAMNKYEKHMKRYDLGSIKDVITFYENRYMKFLLNYADYNN